MKQWAYYNEHDAEKVAALKALMAEGWIAPGEIDSRDIRDVAPIELSRFAQCHFFAGIRLWSVAARAAGIPDTHELWSGSCPCQPFSTAGAGEGIDDDRHLWPHWFWLVAQQRPARVVGEQVATKDGLAWLDLVSADMEGSHYAGGSIDLCSAGFGSPNIRQRQYMCWLADSSGGGWRQEHQIGRGDGSRDREEGNAAGFDARGDPGRLDNGIDDRWREGRAGDHRGNERIEPDADGTAGELGITEREGLERQRGHGDRAPGWQPGSAGSVAEAGDAHRLASADCDGQQPRRLSKRQGRSRKATPVQHGRGQGDGDRGQLCDPLPAPTNGFWADADWLLCRDIDGPKLRPVRRGTFCLAAGHSGRAAELRAYGDAINLQVATTFLKAVKPELMA